MEISIDLIVELATRFWPWVVFSALVFIGFLVSLVDSSDKEPRVGFTYGEMPHMKPIKIDSANKGFWKAIVHWLLGVRTWELTEDFEFKVMDVKCYIPKGFVFDGASVPKFLAMWLSPTGLLLLGGLVHDYQYKYASMLIRDGEIKVNQEQADKLFRDICIEVNGFVVMNYLAYFSLRLFGFLAWNKHKKNGTHKG